MPHISVLMPAYNSEKYIGSAISSILSQSFNDFELIILNDGSVDNTEKIIQGFNDPRIRYYKNEQNKGLTYTRNKMLEFCLGEYIAFLDSDDLAEKERLKKEYEVLSSHPELAFVSSSFHAIDENGLIIKPVWSFNISSSELPVHFLFYNPVATSSVLIRKSALPKLVFREGYPVCEDYDLWTRVIKNSKGSVLPDFLTRYRLYPESICKQQPENIIKIRNKIIFNQLDMYFTGEYTDADALVHLSLADMSFEAPLSKISDIQSWVYKLIGLNKKHNHFYEPVLKQVLYERVLKRFLRLDAYNFTVFKTLMEIKKELQPALTLELRKKEAAILAFALVGKKFISTG